MCMFLHVTKMSDQLLQQWINIKFCVNLSLEMIYGTFNMILKANDKVCNGNSWHPHNPRKLTCWNHTWRQCSSLSLRSRVLYTFESFHEAIQSTKLVIWKYWSCYVKLCIDKAWTLAQQLDSPPWQCSSSQGTLCQAVSGPKIDYWNGTPTLFPWFGSKWLLAVSKNKVCLKGVKISGYWRHSNKMWWQHWKLVHNGSYKNVSSSRSIVGLSMYVAAEGEYFRGDPS